eukprot:7913737-Alexandrium_andersonii.AAC.1
MLRGFFACVRTRWGAANPDDLASALARSPAWPVGCPRVLPPFAYIPLRAQEEAAGGAEWATIQAAV